MDRLKFRIPRTAHEDTALAMDVFPVMLSAEEMVFGLAEMFTQAQFVVAFGQVVPIVSAVIGAWIGIGSGYAAARAEVAKENMLSGVSKGVVMGADDRRGALVKEYFWQHSPQFNSYDKQGGVIAQQCFNQGLVAGFMQGRELNESQKRLLWRDIGKRGGDQSFRGDSKNWTRQQWIDWYIHAAAVFRRFHLK